MSQVQTPPGLLLTQLAARTSTKPQLADLTYFGSGGLDAAYTLGQVLGAAANEADLRAYIALGTPLTVLVMSAVTVSANLAVPANLTLRFMPPGQLQPATGVTITVNGPVVAPPVQIFGGAGTVAFANSACQAEAWVEWWGALADGGYGGAGSGTDNAAAINAAIAALPANGGTIDLCFAGQFYLLRSSINVIDNVANGGRRGQRLKGKWNGRRGDDPNQGTVLIWGGDNATPLMKIHSRQNCVEGFQFVTASGLTCLRYVEFDNPPGESLEQIVTENWVRHCHFNGQQGAVTDHVYGAPSIANDEFNRFDGCYFNQSTHAGVNINNSTGQAKLWQFDDCSWENNLYGIAVAIASFVCNNCNFDPGSAGSAAVAIKFFGGAFDAVSLVNCVSENYTQLIAGGGSIAVNIFGGRFAPNNAGATQPAVGSEYIAGSNQLTLIGCSFDGAAAGFRIRPNDGGSVTIIGVQLPFLGVVPTDNATTIYAYFLNCSVNGVGPINNGPRNSKFATLGYVETNGPVLLNTQGAATNGDPTQGAVLSWGHAGVNDRIRVQELGGYPRQLATVQPPGDNNQTTATFTSGTGNVPAVAFPGYDYAVTFVSAAGETGGLVVHSSCVNATTGEWTLGNVPVGPAGTTSRNVYRGAHGASLSAFGLVGGIANNTTLSFTDTIASPGGAPPGTTTVSPVVLGTYTPGDMTLGGAVASGTSTDSLVITVNGVVRKIPIF